MTTKSEYEQKLQAKLEECQRQISQLEEFAGKTELELEGECYRIIDDLRRLEKVGTQRLKHLRQVNEEYEDIRFFEALAKAVDNSLEWVASKFKHFKK